MLSLSDIPTLNASLNGTSAVLLVTGYVLIRRKNRNAHKLCMLGAVGVSVAFLISYVIYHQTAGFTRFTGQGAIRFVYFSILISHTILATLAIVPMVAVTLFRALKGQFQKHKRIARWTFPIWLYVSITGVIIYWMLYHLT
jgi:putative membrane protein